MNNQQAVLLSKIVAIEDAPAGVFVEVEGCSISQGFDRPEGFEFSKFVEQIRSWRLRGGSGESDCDIWLVRPEEQESK